MDIYSIVKDIRGYASEIAPISDETLSKYNKFDSKEELVLYLKSNGLDFNKLYEIDSVINRLWYIDEEAGVYYSLFALEEDVFVNFHALEAIKQIYEKQSENLMNLEYSVFYTIIPEQLRYYDFARRYKSIPKEKLFDAFEEVYTSVDFGFSLWSNEILKYVYSNTPKYSESEELITIYRGASSDSTPVELAHSWTDSFSVAMWFATRYQMSNVTIYRAKIRKCDIIAYLINRKESEVVCNYEDLIDVEILPMIKVDNELILELREKYGWKYEEYMYTLDDDVYGHNNVHDLQHIKRVLFWSIVLADKLDLCEDELDILAYVALMHDAGRNNDNEDAFHGEMAVRRIENENIEPLILSGEDEYIAKQIIKLHCVSDDIGIKTIMDNDDIYNKEFVINLLKIFKDADALDRVRIKDLDYEQLRFNESKEMCLLSQIVRSKNLIK